MDCTSFSFTGEPLSCQSTPYAPQACITIDRSVNSRSMLAPKSPPGTISGIARHFPQPRVELTAGIAPDVDTLLISAEPAVIARTHCSDGAVEREDASLTRHRADQSGSQLGPGLPPGAEVGPVPVWYSPSVLVKLGRSCRVSVVLACSCRVIVESE